MAKANDEPWMFQISNGSHDDKLDYIIELAKERKEILAQNHRDELIRAAHALIASGGTSGEIGVLASEIVRHTPKGDENG